MTTDTPANYVLRGEDLESLARWQEPVAGSYSFELMTRTEAEANHLVELEFPVKRKRHMVNKRLAAEYAANLKIEDAYILIRDLHPVADTAQEDTPAHDSVDGLCRRMLTYASMGPVERRTRCVPAI